MRKVGILSLMLSCFMFIAYPGIAANLGTEVTITKVTVPNQITVGIGYIEGNYVLIEKIVIINYEEYIAGVLQAEIEEFNAVNHADARKAQSIIARSYAVTNINTREHEHIDAVTRKPVDVDICGTTHHQAFSENPDDIFKTAANATADQGIKYGNSVIDATFFSSSRTHYTRDAEDFWPNYSEYRRKTITPETEGRGGHGVGMSQFGARDLSVAGVGYQDIIYHYYGPVPPYVERVKVIQDEVVMYDAYWENDNNYPNPTRTLKVQTNIPLRIDLDAVFEIHFSERVLTGSNAGEIMVKLENEEAVYVSGSLEEGSSPPEKLSKTLTATQLERIGNGIYTLRIQAKHEFAQDWQLDKDPKTFTYQNHNANNLVGYEPGDDLIHKISIGGLDVALVIDRSGSMDDPKKLPKVKEAAKYFVEDTRIGDQIAISAFDHNGLLVTPLTYIDDEIPSSQVKEGIKAQIDTLTPGGSTNFGVGLQIAYDELKKSTTTMPKTGVLMTNGQHNTGTYDAQVNAFRNEGWPIYTIGFGSDANGDTLRQIADETSGKYYYAESIDITAIYDLISGRIHKDSLIAALKGFIESLETILFGGIWVDPSIDWIKFSAFWGGSRINLSLIRPDGVRIDPAYAASDPDIDYYETNTYSYYVIQKPMPGEWKTELFGVDIPAGGEQFNLNVRASSPIFSDFFLALKPEYNIGEKVDIAVQLADVTADFKLKPISGASVTSEILMPNGKVESLPLLETEAGIYSGVYGNTNIKGLYSVKVVAKGTADSGQFTRTLQTTVQVGKPPFNNPPVAIAKLITQGCGLKIGLPIEFNGSDSNDPDSDSLIYKWNFGDGGSSTDMNPIHEYATSGTYKVMLIVNDGKMDSLSSELEVEIRPKPALVSASYDVPNTTLILDFNLPIMRNPVCFDGIGMEVGDSGNWDFALSDSFGLYVNETKPSKRITVDINRAYSTTINMAIAALVNHHKVDLLLNKGAFVDECGDEVMPAKGTENISIKMETDKYILGVVGDANGNGVTTTYDGGLILKSAHLNDLENVIPVYEAASKTTKWIKAQGYDTDVLMNMIDIDKDGKITSYDAALLLRMLADKKVQAPYLSSNTKNGRLKLRDYHEQNLEVSVELDNVAGVYSADIVLTYDPEELSVVDVSKTPSISEWLSEYGADSGKLKISMAGASQPNLDGSLVVVSFRATSKDSIKKLDITELELNGGKLNSRIENLPKVFAAMQNYPNPFNPDTWIPYQLLVDTNVIIGIYDVSGRLIKSLGLGRKPAGFYITKDKAAYWDGKNEAGEYVASGVYFYTVTAGDFTATKKMVITK